MNTLNNIHALVDIDSQSAKRAIIELSNMMRHVVYESSAETIPISADMKFLENYIELMRVRYSQQIDIRFNYPKNLPSQYAIPPLVLIVFVENAFKHGISYKENSFINITITADNNELTCVVANSRHDHGTQSHSSHERSGIGLNNIIKRMDILFGNRYTLTTDNTDSKVYIVELVIPVTTNK